MASPNPPSTVASVRVVLVPLLFLGLLVTSSLALDHHPSTSSAAGGSGVLWHADGGADGGAVSGRQQHQPGSVTDVRRGTKMVTDEPSRKKGLEDVINIDNVTKDSVKDVLKKYSEEMEDKRTEKTENVRLNEMEGDEARPTRPKLGTPTGWFLDTEAVDVTTVPVVSWLHHQGDTHSSGPGDTHSSGPGDTHSSGPGDTHSSGPGDTHSSGPGDTHSSGPGDTHSSGPGDTHSSGPGDTQDSPPIRSESEGTVLTLQFRAKEHQLILDLHPTRDLLAASYKEPGQEDVRTCEYQGTVRGLAGSWAALSICHGLRGVVVGGDQELLVEPVQGASTLKEPHRVFSANLLQKEPGSCGVGKGARNHTKAAQGQGSSKAFQPRPGTALHRGRREALRGGRLWTVGTTRFVELVLVADSSYYRKHRIHTYSRCRAIVNIVNALYRPLGLVVVLTHLEVWESTDKVQVLSNHEKTLANLRPYRLKLLKERPNLPQDNTVLLTHVDFLGSTVGFATVSGMCSERDSVAVVQDKNQEVGVVSQTLAHEMGHNLGMFHDEANRDCHCHSRKCLMSDTGSPRYDTTTGWSSCSKRDLVTGFESHAFDCLKNVPTVSLPSSSCGDGVVDLEAGEQCDCGPPDYCHNPCCLAHTCRLATNATCASGACCDTQTCQVEPGGLPCRTASGGCDLPEYCTGEDEYCPGDVYRRDGTSCREGKGNCYRGECYSHEGRCREIWGSTATVASSICFTKINTRGGSDGNCGFADPKDTRLLPCAAGDSPCGTLHCQQEQAEKPDLQGSYSYQTQRHGKASCSYILAITSIPTSFWLSPEGAACGENKMCVGQRCVAVAPPAGDCEGGCSGRGVCNSRGHCHCDAGLAPPDCSRLGLGGSIDSGPMRRPRDAHPLFDALFFLLLVLLAVLIIVCCLWEHLRGWWEREGRASTLPCCASCMDVCCCPVMNKVTHWVVTVNPLRKQKNDQREVCREDKETERMLCQVDLDFKDCPPQTNSWGVADERLITEVMTTTPKNTPDLQRKIRLPSNSPVRHHKPTKELDRPTYLQSISADSGCVVDFEESVTKEPLKSQMSMTSLVSVFRRFDSRYTRTASEKENRRSKTSGSQKSMPLSRFVVDPLAGNRTSRQGTPPPGHMRAAFRRSITVDATSSARDRRSGVPQPPPANLKPHKSENNLQNVSILENSSLIHSKNGSNDPSNSCSKESIRSNNSRQNPSGATKESAKQPTTKKPKTPFQNSPSRPKASPLRSAPPLPPLKKPQKTHTTGPQKTDSSSQQDKSAAKGQTTASKTKARHALKAPRGGQDKAGPATAPDTTKKNVKDMAKKFEARN